MMMYGYDLHTSPTTAATKVKKKDGLRLGPAHNTTHWKLVTLFNNPLVCDMATY